MEAARRRLDRLLHNGRVIRSWQRAALGRVAKNASCPITRHSCNRYQHPTARRRHSQTFTLSYPNQRSLEDVCAPVKPSALDAAQKPRRKVLDQRDTANHLALSTDAINGQMGLIRTTHAER